MKKSSDRNPENDPQFRKALLRKIRDEFDELLSLDPDLSRFHADLIEATIEEEFDNRLFRARGPESKLKRTILEQDLFDNEFVEFESNELPPLRIEVLGKTREIEVVISSNLTEETTFLHTLYTNTI